MYTNVSSSARARIHPYSVPIAKGASSIQCCPRMSAPPWSSEFRASPSPMAPSLALTIRVRGSLLSPSFSGTCVLIETWLLLSARAERIGFHQCHAWAFLITKPNPLLILPEVLEPFDCGPPCAFHEHAPPPGFHGPLVGGPSPSPASLLKSWSAPEFQAWVPHRQCLPADNRN